MQILPHWHRKLTHGYQAWCTYAVLAIEFGTEKIDLVAQYLPPWLVIPLLFLGLFAALVKQESVSGKAPEPAA